MRYLLFFLLLNLNILQASEPIATGAGVMPALIYLDEESIFPNLPYLTVSKYRDGVIGAARKFRYQSCHPASCDPLSITSVTTHEIWFDANESESRKVVIVMPQDLTTLTPAQVAEEETNLRQLKELAAYYSKQAESITRRPMTTTLPSPLPPHISETDIIKGEEKLAFWTYINAHPDLRSIRPEELRNLTKAAEVFKTEHMQIFKDKRFRLEE